jgi:alkylation response protein AidB-like acyl-CoA dehydrogenase
MKIELTSEQQACQQAARDFVTQAIIPRAEAYDEAEQFPPDLIAKIATAGYLGANVPAEYGGLGLDAVSYGLLCEEFGRGCASARSLLTVQSMVLLSLLRWGSPAQKTAWIERLTSGAAVAAFALSEPNAGSDATSIAATAVLDGRDYLLNGRKKWITFGQIADLFLLFAKVEGQMSAFLAEKDSPGLTITPIQGMAGCRASMLAELHLDDCRIPAANIVGRPGLGWPYVGAMALDHGRYTIACGCVGLAQACLEASVSYAAQRQQFNAPLGNHQLIQQMITEMAVKTEAARLLCYKAGYLRQQGDPGAILATSMAKYFAATTASQAAADAVQIHGANGFTRAYPVQRHWRDAKVMELIEGSTQIQQVLIGKEVIGKETVSF